MLKKQPGEKVNELDEANLMLQDEVNKRFAGVVSLCHQVGADTKDSLEQDQLLREIQRQVLSEYKLSLKTESIKDVLQMSSKDAADYLLDTIVNQRTNSQSQTAPAAAYLPIPGVQVINARHIQVDMLHLKIADKDLSEGRFSVTPDAPIKVDYNINKKTFRLCDGYHRYLEKRGGSLSAALAQSKAGEFPDFAVDVSLVKVVHKGPFGESYEPLTEEETQDYLTQLLGKRQRLARAQKQGFDIKTTWYHGSIPAVGDVGSEITAFEHEKVGNNYWQDKQGFFFISDPALASNYASHNSIGKTVPGGSVYPVYLAAERVFVVNDVVAKKNGWALPSVEDVISVWDNHHTEIMSKAGDADAIEIVDISNRQSMRVMFNPANIRSVYASFLPEHRESHQLLGHDYTPSLPRKMVAKVVSESLLPIAKSIEVVLNDNPHERDAQLAKKILNAIQGQDWPKEDKIAVLNAAQDRDALKLPIEARAKAITLAIEENVLRNRSLLSTHKSVELVNSDCQTRLKLK